MPVTADDERGFASHRRFQEFVIGRVGLYHAQSLHGRDKFGLAEHIADDVIYHVALT